MVLFLLFVSRVTAAVGTCRCRSDIWHRGTRIDLPEIENQVDPAISSEVQDGRRLGGQGAKRVDFLLQAFVLQPKLLGALLLCR
jgi:hypothetical protein